MSSKYLTSTIDFIRLLVVVVILSLLAVFVITLDSNPWFLSSSAVIVVLSLVNYIDLKGGKWAKYSLFMFIGMICGFIGDLLMAGIIYITPIEILNGVILFGIGHVIYLIGLKERSPLLLKSQPSEGGRLMTRNLLIWIVSIVLVLLLFFSTVFNPTYYVVSIGLLGYGILLVTVLSFALTKWFDEFPLTFRAAIFTGFFLFIFSDWLIGVHHLTDSYFLSGPWVGITYIFAQLLIQLSAFLGARGTK